MLFTYTSGQPTSPAIVFLHGGGVSGRMWQPQLERLADSYYCLAPDLPEHGKSIDADPFRIDETARQIAKLIDERVPGKRAHLVGLSAGGVVALTMMDLVPEYIEDVIVSGTSGRMGKIIGTIGLYSGIIYKFKFIKLEPLIKLGFKNLSVPALYHDMLTEDTLRTSNETINKHLFKELMAAPMPCDSSISTLVVVGERENFIAKQYARKIVACLKQSQGFIVSGMNHVWNLQNPDLFAEMVCAWIEHRPLPAGLRPLGK